MHGFWEASDWKIEPLNHDHFVEHLPCPQVQPGPDLQECRQSGKSLCLRLSHPSIRYLAAVLSCCLCAVPVSTKSCTTAPVLPCWLCRAGVDAACCMTTGKNAVLLQMLLHFSQSCSCTMIKRPSPLLGDPSKGLRAILGTTLCTFCECGICDGCTITEARTKHTALPVALIPFSTFEFAIGMPLICLGCMQGLMPDR